MTLCRYRQEERSGHEAHRPGRFRRTALGPGLELEQHKVMDRSGFHRHFRRILRSFQLYPSGSPVRDEAIQALQAALSGECAPSNQGISMAFLEEGAYLDGTRLDAGPEGGRLDRQLYELGVLEIRFLPGLDCDELSRFFEPLARALLGLLNPVDEDLSVLLWEADLSHIACFLYEDPDDDAQEVMEAEEIASPVAPDLGEYVDPDVFIGEPGVPGQGVILNEAERMEILTSYRREEREEHSLKYGLILLELMRGEDDTDEGDRLLESMEQYLEAAAGSGRFRMLRMLRDAVEPELSTSHVARSVLSSVDAWFRKPCLYLGLVQQAPKAGADLEAAGLFLSSAPSETLPLLVAAVLDQSSSTDPTIREAVEMRLAGDQAGQALCLKSDDPRVRNAALRLLRPGPGEARLLRPLLKDPDPDTRESAVKALARSGGAHGLSCLLDALGDRDETVRIAAARGLGAHGGRRALEPLLRVLISREFETREFAEKRAFFRAAATASPDEVWPVLARMAERRRIFPSRKHDERRRAALEALATLKADVRRSLRNRWSGPRAGLLRQFEAVAAELTGSAGQAGEPSEPGEAP